MNEYNAAITALRNQGLIPQTPPPKYKLRASARSRNTRINVIYNSGNYSETLPPAYEDHRASVSSMSSEGTTSSCEDNIVTVDVEAGIANPTFQPDPDFTNTIARERNSTTLDSDEQLNREFDRIAMQSCCMEMADEINTCTDFESSLGEVTHL